MQIGINVPDIQRIGHTKPKIMLLAVQELPEKWRDVNVIRWEIERGNTSDRPPQKRVDAAGVDDSERPNSTDDVFIDLNDDLAEGAIARVAK
jgi:hypothetical protein